MKLSEAWKMYKGEKRIIGFSPQTLKAYGLQLSLLIQFLSDISIESITTKALRQYLAESSENLKPSSLPFNKG